MSKKIIIKRIIRFFLLIMTVIATSLVFIRQDWFNVSMGVLTIILTILLIVFEQKFKLKIPLIIELIIILYVYSCIFLGEIGNFYRLVEWWDSFTHLLSGIAWGLIGFLLLYVLDKQRKIKAKPILLVLFVFCFIITVGISWEIGEFALDSLTGSDYQGSRNLCQISSSCDSRIGLMDTMIDISLDFIGAIIVCILSWIYLTKNNLFSKK